MASTPATPDLTPYVSMSFRGFCLPNQTYLGALPPPHAQKLAGQPVFLVKYGPTMYDGDLKLCITIGFQSTVPVYSVFSGFLEREWFQATYRPVVYGSGREQFAALNQTRNQAQLLRVGERVALAGPYQPPGCGLMFPEGTMCKVAELDHTDQYSPYQEAKYRVRFDVQAPDGSSATYISRFPLE